MPRRGPLGSGMELKAVLFDLDGTLIDSLADLGEAVNRMLAELGFPGHAAAAYREFIGEGARRLVERALPGGVRMDESLVEQALALYQRHYAACWHEQTGVYPGLPELLADLAAAGLPLGVISNKPDAFTQLCVAHFFPQTPFAIVFGQREGVERKPDPAAALEAASLLGVTAAECAYVGDSGVDMRFAQAAGMRGIGVAWGFRGREEMVENGAAVVVPDAAGLREELTACFAALRD